MNKYLASIIIMISSISVSTLAGEHEKKHGAQLLISDAYIRALPPGQPNTAAFMTMKNPHDKTYTLKTLYSDAAEKVELHSHSMEGGLMQMRPIEGFVIGADADAVFSPGHNHVMFIGLKRPLKEGEDVLLNLCFTEFCQQVKLPVVSVLNENASSHHH